MPFTIVRPCWASATAVSKSCSIGDQLAAYGLRYRSSRHRAATNLVLGELRLELGQVGELPGEVVVGVRPEHTRPWDGDPGLVGPIEGRVEFAESLGRETLVGVLAPGESRFVVAIDGLAHVEPGSSLRFGLRRGWLYLFDAADGHALTRV